MKVKVIALAIALTPITAVAGNASCGAGQGSGIDVNATTQVVTYFCYDITPPTQAEIETQAKQRIEQTLSQQANANPITQVAQNTISNLSPVTEPIERPRVLIINATTGETIEREYNDVEMAQWRIDNSTYQIRQEAYEIARSSASAGVNSCVNWSALDMEGTECYYEPVPVTEEEINDYWNVFKISFPDWFNWNWSMGW